MNEYQQKSLQLISDLLKHMDNNVFLQQYESVENHFGPTVDHFFVRSHYNSFKKSLIEMECVEILAKDSVEIKVPTFQGENKSYSANDSSYSEYLAA